MSPEEKTIMISSSIRIAGRAALLAGLMLGGSLRGAPAEAPAPTVQLGDSLSDIKAKLGEPRSEVDAGDLTALIYPTGQIMLKNGHATSIMMGGPPPPAASATTAHPVGATPAPTPAPSPAPTPAAATPPEKEEDHPPDFRLVERKDGEGAVTIFAESDTNTEFTVTLNVDLNNMTASRPLPATIDSAGQKSVELVQLRRDNPKLAWSYHTSFHARPGAQRALKTSDAVYLLPYLPYETHRLIQGNLGKFSHFAGSGSDYAWDFACDPGTLVCAARDGVVTGIRQDFTLGGTDEKFKSMGNYIIIEHADGVFTEYYHLQHHGAMVTLGQRVSAGQPIGKSGATGYATGPHIHFAVFQNIDGQTRLTMPVRFKTKQGFLDTLKEGESY